MVVIKTTALEQIKELRFKPHGLVNEIDKRIYIELNPIETRGVYNKNRCNFVFNEDDLNNLKKFFESVDYFVNGKKVTNVLDLNIVFNNQLKTRVYKGIAPEQKDGTTYKGGVLVIVPRYFSVDQYLILECVKYWDYSENTMEEEPDYYKVDFMS